MIFTAGCNEKQSLEYSSVNFDLIKLSEGVYGCIHKFGGKAICNVDIISTSKTAELIRLWEPQKIKAEKEYAPKQFAYFDSLLNAYNGDSTDRKFLEIQMWRPYFETLSKSGGLRTSLFQILRLCIIK